MYQGTLEGVNQEEDTKGRLALPSPNGIAPEVPKHRMRTLHHPSKKEKHRALRKKRNPYAQNLSSSQAGVLATCSLISLVSDFQVSVSFCSLQGKKKRRSREKQQESNTGEALPQ